MRTKLLDAGTNAEFPECFPTIFPASRRPGSPDSGGHPRTSADTFSPSHRSTQVNTMPTHFNVGSQTVRGKVRPVVAWTIAGRKHRRFFTSKDAARGWAANQTEERAEVGGLFDALPPHERGELVAVWHEAQQLGATLRQCLDHWRATRIEESVCLRVAIDRLVAAKRIANRRASYVENMETYLRAFARGREEMRLESISQTDVETWLAVAKNASSRATRLGRLAALFAFAVRRGWLLRSPCARIERVSVEHAPPVILSVPECREFLTATRRLAPHALAFAVLGLFAGVRPEELGRSLQYWRGGILWS